MAENVFPHERNNLFERPKAIIVSTERESSRWSDVCTPLPEPNMYKLTEFGSVGQGLWPISKPTTHTVHCSYRSFWKHADKLFCLARYKNLLTSDTATAECLISQNAKRFSQSSTRVLRHFRMHFVLVIHSWSISLVTLLLWLINFDIYPTQRQKEQDLASIKKTPVTLIVSDSHVLGHLRKLSKETDRKSVVAFCLWTFYYVKGKLLLMSQCFIMCYRRKTISFFFLTTSFDIKGGLCEVYSLCWYSVCGWSCVSVTTLHSNSDTLTDHPVVFTRPWLESNQFYVVCGQQTAFDLRELAGASIVWVCGGKTGNVRQAALIVLL